MSQPAQQSALPSDLKNLSVDERIHLIEVLWESIVDEQDALEITQPQREELDRRIEAYRASPEEGTSWEEVKAALDPSR